MSYAEPCSGGRGSAEDILRPEARVRYYSIIGTYSADRGAWRETLRLGYPAIRRSTRIAARPRVQLPTALQPRPRGPATLDPNIILGRVLSMATM